MKSRVRHESKGILSPTLRNPQVFLDWRLDDSKFINAPIGSLLDVSLARFEAKHNESVSDVAVPAWN